MTRTEALEVLVARLREDRRVARDRARATAASATHVESKQENDKDTRALEETYLAAGQAQRVADLDLDLAELRNLRRPNGHTVAVGSLITLDDGDVERRVLVARRGGGLSVGEGDARVQVVTPGSPLGRAVIGKEEGDEAVVKLKGGPRTYEIVSVD